MWNLQGQFAIKLSRSKWASFAYLLFLFKRAPRFEIIKSISIVLYDKNYYKYQVCFFFEISRIPGILARASTPASVATTFRYLTSFTTSNFYADIKKHSFIVTVNNRNFQKNDFLSYFNFYLRFPAVRKMYSS